MSWRFGSRSRASSSAIRRRSPFNSRSSDSFSRALTNCFSTAARSTASLPTRNSSSPPESSAARQFARYQEFSRFETFLANEITLPRLVIRVSRSNSETRFCRFSSLLCCSEPICSISFFSVTFRESARERRTSCWPIALVIWWFFPATRSNSPSVGYSCGLTPGTYF